MTSPNREAKSGLVIAVVVVLVLLVVAGGVWFARQSFASAPGRTAETHLGTPIDRD